MRDNNRGTVKRTLLIVATLDTKGREAAYVKECVESLGVDVLVMNVGTMSEPSMGADFSLENVLKAAGRDPFPGTSGVLRRSEAVEAVQKGGIAIARKLLSEGRVDGIFGLGGGTGTAIAASVMRSLPFGMPKVMVSTVASRDVRQYVGTKDIVMFHSVADLLGWNHFVGRVLQQAAHAVCAMMEVGVTGKEGRPMVAVTAYGINSRCAMNVEPLLQERGYEMIGFHANGVGGMAMEEMTGEGLIEGVLDLTVHEVADEMFGGYCRGIGQRRFRAAGEVGIPLLVAPGGLDNAVFSPFYPMPDKLRGRRRRDHDDRFCVRMEREEMIVFARIIAERLNDSRGQVFVLIPSRGFSEADKPGAELYDPETDRVFTEELKGLLREDIALEEMDAHISDPEFASRAVYVIDTMIGARRQAGTERPETGCQA